MTSLDIEFERYIETVEIHLKAVQEVGFKEIPVDYVKRLVEDMVKLYEKSGRQSVGVVPQKSLRVGKRLLDEGVVDDHTYKKCYSVDDVSVWNSTIVKTDDEEEEDDDLACMEKVWMNSLKTSPLNMSAPASRDYTELPPISLKPKKRRSSNIFPFDKSFNEMPDDVKEQAREHVLETARNDIGTLSALTVEQLRDIGKLFNAHILRSLRKDAVFTRIQEVLNDLLHPTINSD